MPSSSNVHNIFASLREDGVTTPQTPQVVDGVAMCSDEEDNMEEVEEEEGDVDSGELEMILKLTRSVKNHSQNKSQGQ